MADVIYLDYNCFQRGFDDHRQIRIRMEALACDAIFAKAEESKVRLVWSFMHQDECMVCPFPERKLEAMGLSTLCNVRVGPTDEIRQSALSFQQKAHLSANDAIHLACACSADVDMLLTCDDEFLRVAHRATPKVAVLNPVDYVRQKEGEW